MKLANRRAGLLSSLPVSSHFVLNGVPALRGWPATALVRPDRQLHRQIGGYAEEAERAGAFREDALNVLDAAGATDDLADALEEPAFLDDEGPSAVIPPLITTTNARELYDLRPGETVSKAIARRNVKGVDRCRRPRTKHEGSRTARLSAGSKALSPKCPRTSCRTTRAKSSSSRTAAAASLHRPR